MDILNSPFSPPSTHDKPSSTYGKTMQPMQKNPHNPRRKTQRCFRCRLATPSSTSTHQARPQRQQPKHHVGLPSSTLPAASSAKNPAAISNLVAQELNTIFLFVLLWRMRTKRRFYFSLQRGMREYFQLKMYQFLNFLSM